MNQSDVCVVLTYYVSKYYWRENSKGTDNASENRVKLKIRCKYPEESKHRVREIISFPGCFKVHIPTKIEQCFDKSTLIS